MSATSDNKEGFHLAELNIAHLKDRLDSPLLADFVAALDEVNTAADAADGFIWRLKEEADDTSQASGGAGNATDFRPFGPDFIVTLSLWRDVASLRRYMLGNPHQPIMARRTQWFHRMTGPHLVMWWVPAGHIPSLSEAAKKLQQIADYGPSQDAFDFNMSFFPPEPGQPANSL